MTDDEASEELVRRVRQSVRLRMISEVPLGAFLSGGVDSSAVVATMAGLSESPVNTCSIAFTESEFDESRYAQRVADQYHTRHFVDRVDSDDFGMLDQLAGIYDEPFADSSALPTYRVCELARRHVTVALSGDGGDETFAGYRRYQTFLAEQRWRNSVPEMLRSNLLPVLARLYPELPRAPRFLRAKASLEAMTRDPISAYLHEISVVREVDRRRLFSRSFRASLDGYSTLQLFRAHAARAQSDDPLALIQYLDINTYLVGDINTKVDRASMAHSLEVREPLMDHPLVEWMASLPSNLKIRDGTGKYLLKQAFDRKLPADILHRRKMGFAVPLAAWFRGPLRARIRALADSPALLATGIFDASALRSLAEQHESGARDYSAALWSILMFDAFVRRTTGVGDQPSHGHRSRATSRDAAKVA
jgi:asparagine synthase (glutamine-hydrolysing)